MQVYWLVGLDDSGDRFPFFVLCLVRVWVDWRRHLWLSLSAPPGSPQPCARRPADAQLPIVRSLRRCSRWRAS